MSFGNVAILVFSILLRFSYDSQIKKIYIR